MQLIENARARGVDVWADQYPYATSGSDGNTILIPSWAIAVNESPVDGARGAADFHSALRRVMADSVRNANLRRDIAHEIQRRGGASQVVVFDHPVAEVVGKSVAEVAALWKVSPIDAAIQLQLRGRPDRSGGGRVRGFSLSEVDIEAYAAQPWVATASDAGIALPSDGPAVHARFYGTFPRKIRHYAHTRGVLSVESAIRSMTSLPAQILGLRDRGQIREGLVADLALIDLERIRDKATFVEPHQYAEGVEYVWVGGIAIVEQGKPNGKLPGRTLDRGASRP
jgi:N-acyl-D-amino-acid deacylase